MRALHSDAINEPLTTALPAASSEGKSGRNMLAASFPLMIRLKHSDHHHAEDSRAQRIGALCCGHAMMSQSDPGLNEPAAPTEMTFMPFMVQIAGVPSSLCHKMSDLASRL